MTKAGPRVIMKRSFKFNFRENLFLEDIKHVPWHTVCREEDPDLALNTLEVANHQFEKSIKVIKPSGSYVAIGEHKSGNVVIFDHNGNRLLVSYF